MAGVQNLFEAYTAFLVNPFNHDLLVSRSDEFVWNSLIAMGVAIHLLGVHALVKHRPTVTLDRITQTIRWISGASFSLYVAHFFTLRLTDAMLSDTSGSSQLIQLCAVFFVAFLFIPKFEGPLVQWRRLNT